MEEVRASLEVRAVVSDFHDVVLTESHRAPQQAVTTEKLSMCAHQTFNIGRKLGEVRRCRCCGGRGLLRGDTS